MLHIKMILEHKNQSLNVIKSFVEYKNEFIEYKNEFVEYKNEFVEYKNESLNI